MVKNEPTPLSLRLKQIREQRGFTQEFVAEKLNIEIGTLSGYERAYRKPSPEMLSSLADVYVCSVDYLLGRVASPTDSLVEERAATPEDFTGEIIHIPPDVAQRVIDALSNMDPDSAEKIAQNIESAASLFPKEKQDAPAKKMA